LLLLQGVGALIPTIELGLGKDSDCEGLIAEARRAAPLPGDQDPAALPSPNQKAAVPPQ